MTCTSPHLGVKLKVSPYSLYTVGLFNKCVQQVHGLRVSRHVTQLIKSRQNSEMCDAGKTKYYLNISFVGPCQKLNVVIICIIKVARIGKNSIISTQQIAQFFEIVTKEGIIIFISKLIWVETSHIGP